MMHFYTRKEGARIINECPAPQWEASYDILVVGGGSGGVYAALSAAREGKSVLLLEKTAWCGGQHVQGLVNGYYYGVRRGMYTQTDDRTRQDTGNVFYDPTDGKRIVIAERLRQSGVQVKTLCRVAGVYAENQCVFGVSALMGGELQNIACTMLIDATSEGYILRMLPIAMRMGREWDGQPQPFSGVRSVYLDQSKYDGGLSVTVGSMGRRYRLFHEYRDNGYVNQYDQQAYSGAIIRAHASHLNTLGEHTRFLYLAPIIGLREGCTFEGEQTVTLADALDWQNAPKNVMLWCYSDIDKHGHDMAFDDELYQDWFVNCNMGTCTVYVPLPVGAIVPKGWKGLATAGRCHSSDTYANSAARMNVDCFRIGEACGTLCAMAADRNRDIMSIPYEAYRAKMEGYGFIETSPDLTPSFWTPAMGGDRRFVHWMTDIGDIRAALSTDCPAVALWSCRLLGKDTVGDAVYEMTKTQDEMLRLNAGVALGVMRDARALPILREVIRRREPFFYMDCRRSNQMRSVIAICLCGQMADEGAIDALLPILRPEEFEKPMYHQLLEPEYKRTIVKEQNAVYFQHLSHAVAALVKIARAHENMRADIRCALHAALDDGAYIRRVTDTPPWNAFYRAADNCRSYVDKLLG